MFFGLLVWLENAQEYKGDFRVYATIWFYQFLLLNSHLFTVMDSKLISCVLKVMLG
jgi:hypothetical protein